MKYVIIEELVLAVIVYKLDAILLQLKCTYSQGTDFIIKYAIKAKNV